MENSEQLAEQAAPQEAERKPNTLLIGGIVAAALLFFFGVVPGILMTITPHPHGTLYDDPQPAPDFELPRAGGGTFRLSDYEGKVVVLYFGYTSCPDVCPTTLQLLSAARSKLEENGHEPLPRIVLVSVDPERDTPEIMGTYVDYFGPGNLGITGPLEEIDRLTSGLGIYYQKQPANGDNYVVDHSAAVLVIDPEGRFSALFSGPHKVESFVHDLPLIIRGDR